MKIENRLKKLRQRLAEKGVEAILISQPENRHYLSGFDGSFGFLLISQQTKTLATDFRYLEQAKRQAPDYKLFRISGDVENWLPELTDGLNLRQLGFEADHVSFAIYRRLSNVQDKLVAVDMLVESLRAVKEPGEIELITEAAAISDAVIDAVTIQAGMTEQEVAWELEKSLHDRGSQTLPFDIIVASGPNAALPHASPSQREIQDGEPVVIDIGARVQGYGSDLSRTICLGKADDTFKRVYDTVLGAQLAAIAGITAGIAAKQADALARAPIEQAGYGDGFGHGLGHGLGLESHEQPFLAPGSQDNLVDGMVFTIEPGIYLSGWGGVRIEDTVVMENGKIRLLSRARK
ncbi:MAG: Xaa-Pro peptidase family protein [Dehalococcoidales bacterium]